MVIKKKGKYYILYSKKTGRVLGKFKSRKAALLREKQIYYFSKVLKGGKRK